MQGFDMKIDTIYNLQFAREIDEFICLQWFTKRGSKVLNTSLNCKVSNTPTCQLLGAARCSFISYFDDSMNNIFLRLNPYFPINIEILMLKKSKQNIPATYFDWFQKRKQKMCRIRTSAMFMLMLADTFNNRKWFKVNETCANRTPMPQIK